MTCVSRVQIPWPSSCSGEHHTLLFWRCDGHSRVVGEPTGRGQTREYGEGWMRSHATSGVLIVFVVALGCTMQDPSQSESSDPELRIEIFARGAVSSDLPEFAASFTPSGDTVFFNRTSSDRSRIDLLYSVQTDSEWSEAQPFPPLAGVRAIDPFVTIDGTALHFSSDLPREGMDGGVFNLWRLTLGDVQATPVALPAPVNTDSSDVFNSFSEDGTMVFSSRRDGVRRVYETTWDGGVPSEPTLLSLGSGESASNPAIHRSGGLLVFARAAENGASDLHVACRQGAEWGEPVVLPEPVNSSFAEFAPSFDPAYLYFTSERPGVVGEVAGGQRPPGDIYRTPIQVVEAMCGLTSSAP